MVKLESTYLGLVVAEVFDLLLQMLDLLLVLLVDLHLVGQVPLGGVVLFLHLDDPGLQRFFVFLALGQLDLNIAQTLF